jgi:nucleoside-diphosphate-sugar epimerase
MKVAQQATGVPAPRIVAPPTMMMATAGMMSVVEKIVPVPETYSSEYLRVNAGVTYIGTNAKAVRELGYNPRSLEDGLPETLRHEMQLLGMK